MQAATTPAPWPVPNATRGLTIGLMAIGAASFAYLLTQNVERAWYAYLTGYFYVFCLSIGGLFFTAIQHLTKAGWSVNVRRFCEAFTSYLPVAGLFALVYLVLGAPHVYEWMDRAKVAADEMLSHKAGYLNPTFFAVRIIIFFGLWIGFARKIVGLSLAQDQSGDEALTHRAVPWSIAFLLSFAVSFSLFSVDLMMSLEPHWSSTVYGVYCFAGMFQSTIAALILTILAARRRVLPAGFLDENHLHDLGKFLFAFTIFWAYIAYSQYMLMWYANLPEETTFYIPRVTGSWMYVSAALILFKFVVPFLALLSRRAKRQASMLAVCSILILVMQFVDFAWLSYPSLNAEQILVSIPEILVWLGFVGTFVYVIRNFLSRHAIIPGRDPRIQESMHHHVVY